MPNPHWLACGVCGRKAEYDLGLIAVHPDVHPSNPESADLAQGLGDQFQCTGYFRCKYCNAAGPWAFVEDFTLFLMDALLRLSVEGPIEGFPVRPGHLKAFDGTEPKWATDLETHILGLIAQTPDDAYLWNRLGNVYRRGGVPELAVIAYEQSIQRDPRQVESRISLANLLYDADDFDHCIEHAHLALLHAAFYRRLPLQSLHELLCSVLRNLLASSLLKDDMSLFFPPTELAEEIAADHGLTAHPGARVLELPELHLNIDDLRSFSEVAMLYLGAAVPAAE